MRDAILALGRAKELGLDGQTYRTCTTSHSSNIGDAPRDHMSSQPVLVATTAAFVAFRSWLTHLGRVMPGLHTRGCTGGRSEVSMATILRSILSGSRFRQEQSAAVCEAADRLARRFGLGSGVRGGLEHAHTRWDSKGLPHVAGGEIAVSARVVRLCHLVEVFGR